MIRIDLDMQIEMVDVRDLVRFGGWDGNMTWKSMGYGRATEVHGWEWRLLVVLDANSCW